MIYEPFQGNSETFPISSDSDLVAFRSVSISVPVQVFRAVSEQFPSQI